MLTTTPRERPILFSGPMIQALLDGRKTMTRRVILPQPIGADETVRDIYARGLPAAHPCPYGQPGDRLWVREAFRYWGAGNAFLDYRATPDSRISEDQAGPWRPSIFMPRWASRLMLEVVSVRVERLGEINEDDARAEGCEPRYGEVTSLRHPPSVLVSAVDAFADLWDSINGARPGCAWSDNPWVFAIEFRRVEA